MTPSAVLSCALQRWQPGIGDPTPAGWITVAAYACAAALALVVAGGLRPRPTQRTERWFWLGAALFLAALAVNKQLDLQSFLTAVGRCVAKAQGWYDARRGVQRDAVLAMIAAAAIAGGLIAWRLAPTLARTGPALFGLVAITAFVLARAVGFHHVDALIGMRVSGLRLNWVFEIGGIAIFTLGALWALARR